MQSLLHPDWTGVEILSSLGPKPNYIYIEQEGVKASWKPIHPIKEHRFF